MTSNELHIKLDGLELNEKDLASLQRDVNALVLKHVAATKQHGFVGSVTGAEAISIGKLNPRWLGIWLKNFTTKIDMEHAKFNPVQTIGTH